ncbi:ABC transporter ATP-binding protein, partial [Arthrobacter deserti]|nr:ABC transporter ATP-binding protein [Arthrobacter deserti]
PGHIKSIVGIGLGEERDVTGAEFNALKRQISALVHEGVEVHAA